MEKRRNISLRTLLLLVSLLACSRHTQLDEAKYTIAPDVYENFELTADYDERITIKIKPRPMIKLYEKWKKNHPEAKYTPDKYDLQVMTRREFKELSKVLSKNTIKSMALKFYLQNAGFSVNCIGLTQSKRDFGKKYFMMVDSDDIIKFRVQLQNAYLKRGGSRYGFYPATFKPYVVIASSTNDFRFNSRIDERDCLERVKVFGP